jgi:hypothetical protein
LFSFWDLHLSLPKSLGVHGKRMFEKNKDYPLDQGLSALNVQKYF